VSAIKVKDDDFLGEWRVVAQASRWSKDCGSLSIEFARGEPGKLSMKCACTNLAGETKRVQHRVYFSTASDVADFVAYFYHVLRRRIAFLFMSDDNKHAIVSVGRSRKTFYIMSRDKGVGQDEFVALIEKAEELGLDVSKLSVLSNGMDGEELKLPPSGDLEKMEKQAEGPASSSS